MHAEIAETQSGDLLALGRHERFVHEAERGFALQRISGGSLDAQQASVGAKSDFAKLGQVAESAADLEVADVVDSRLGAQGATEFVVLFEAGVGTG